MRLNIRRLFKKAVSCAVLVLLSVACGIITTFLPDLLNVLYPNVEDSVSITELNNSFIYSEKLTKTQAITLFIYLDEVAKFLVQLIQIYQLNNGTLTEIPSGSGIEAIKLDGEIVGYRRIQTETETRGFQSTQEITPLRIFGGLCVIAIILFFNE